MRLIMSLPKHWEEIGTALVAGRRKTWSAVDGLERWPTYR